MKALSTHNALPAAGGCSWLIKSGKVTYSLGVSRASPHSSQIICLMFLDNKGFKLVKGLTIKISINVSNKSCCTALYSRVFFVGHKLL